MKKPAKLQPGDTVATISLSWGGAFHYPYRYLVGKQQLERALGVHVVETRHALRDADWLAHNPQARAEDLMEAFANPAIKAIISNIGGEDSIRILPYLDSKVIRGNPKIFLGYSDTTITHFACYHAGLVSFYGPAILAGFAENGGIFPYMEASVRKVLCSSEPIGLVAPNQNGWTVEHLDWGDPALQRRRTLRPTTGWRWLQGHGICTGTLIGGCLEVLDWLRGTEVWPTKAAWDGAILFIETSEEAPTPLAVVRLLRPLAAMGILRQLHGIIFGRPGGQLADDAYLAYDAALLKVVVEENGLTDLPIVTNVDFGHTDPMMVLPYGVQAELNCETQTMRIIESAVVDR
jgi:muramoyltetrapeptide carboxypeptidase LdcA involved in peptidoglycan recycling